MTRLKECEYRAHGEYCFKLSIPNNPLLEGMVPETICDQCGPHLPNAKCHDCGKRATVWIQRGTGGHLFLCDTCAFHLARIILQDIAHAKLEQTKPGEPC